MFERCFRSSVSRGSLISIVASLLVFFCVGCSISNETFHLVQARKSEAEAERLRAQVERDAVHVSESSAAMENELRMLTREVEATQLMRSAQ